jgi:hypothetical protein
VILRLLARGTPFVLPGVQTVQTSPISSGSEVVQIEVRGRDRSCPIQACTVTGSTPRANHKARCCVSEMVDASAFGNGGLNESPLEGGGVQLVA